MVVGTLGAAEDGRRTILRIWGSTSSTNQLVVADMKPAPSSVAGITKGVYGGDGRRRDDGRRRVGKQHAHQT